MKVKNLTKELKKGICLFLTAAMVFTNTGMTAFAEEAALVEETVPAEETAQTEEPQQEADTTETDAASTISAEENITEETDKSLSEEPTIRTESSENVLTENDFTKEEPTKEQTEQESAENTSKEDMTETEEVETAETVSEKAETEILLSNTASGTYQENGNDITWAIDADGKLTVEGTGDFSDFEYSNGAPWWEYREDIKSAEIKTTGMTNASYMFYECSNLESADFSGCDMSNVTTVNGIFSDCSSLKIANFSGCNLSNVTSMNGMFDKCNNLTIANFSGCNLSSLTNVYRIFDGCGNLTTVNFSGSDLSSLTNNYDMFANCGSNFESIDFSGCDLSGVTRLDSMFQDISVKDINFSNMDLSNVTSILKMFNGCSNLERVNFSNTDLSNVTTWMDGVFEGCISLKSVDFSNTNLNSVPRTYKMFSDCSNLTTVNFDNCNLSHVTDMRNMFDNCVNLVNFDLSNNNLSNVTNLSYMFNGCSSLESVDFGNCDLSGATGINYMFNGCSSLKNVNFSGADLSNLTSLYYTFDGFSSLETVDFSGADLSNLESMVRMFSGTCLKSINFKDCNMNNVDCGNMFMGCADLTSLDLSSLDTSKVTDMRGMFSDCSGLTSLDVSHFDTSNVTDMSNMFSGCSGLTSLDVSSFDTSGVTDMSNMFSGCSGLTSLDVSHFDTSGVTGKFGMCGMFRGCSGLTSLDVSHFDTSNVIDMSFMFYGCSGLTSLNVNNFDTGSVTKMSYMFNDCSGLTSLNVNNFDTGSVTDMSYMFRNCSELTSLNVNNFDTGSVTKMSYMFNGCSGLTSLDVSSFDMSSVTNTEIMFDSCSKLTRLNVNGFDTGSVTKMSYMFNGCSGLTSLDVSSFDTSNVTDMSYMFSGCSGLTSLDVSGFDAGNVTDMSYMFSGCSGLTSLDVSGFDAGNVNLMSSMFNGCSNIKSLDLSSFDLHNMSSYIYDLFNKCDSLERIYTPRNLPKGRYSGSLPNGGWYDISGETYYGSLPEELEHSILLKRNQTSEAVSPFITAIKTKTVYSYGIETIDMTDLTVLYYGNDGTVTKLTDADYTTNISELDLSKAGEQTLTVTYNGLTANVKIKLLMFLDENSVTLPTASYTYNGKAQKPKPTIVYSINDTSVTLKEGIDYTVAYQNNINAYEKSADTTQTENPPTVIIKGRGAYSGVITKTFSIQKASAPQAEEKIVELSNYTAADRERRLNLAGCFKGYGTKKKYTAGTPVEDNTISGDVLTSSGILSLNVSSGVLSCKTNAGTVGDFVTIPITVSFENYKDAILNVKLVFVEKSSTEKETVKITGIDIDSRGYNGQEISYTGSIKAATEDGTDVTDKVTLTYTYSGTQADGSAYTATSSAPVNAGNYTLTVAVAKDNEHYAGSAKYPFSIAKAPLTVTARDMGVKIGAPLPESADYQYDTMGLLAEDYLTVPPTLTCNIANTETEGTYEIIPAGADAGMNYEITYKNGTLTVSETGESAAYYAVTFDLLGKGNNITNTGVKEGSLLETPQVPTADGYTFTGWYKDNGCTVLWDFANDTVQADTTLYAGWKANGSIGGDDVDDSPYQDDERIDLKSVSAEIAKIKDKVYDGNEYEPVVKVTAKDGTKKITLTEGADYRVIYKNNINASTDENKGTVIVKGNGIYKGQIEKNFTITKKPIKKLKVNTGGITTATTGSDLSTLPIYVYDGATLLAYNKDYTLSGYEVKKSTATVTVTATDNSNYSGTTVAKLTIYEGGADTKFILPENITLKPEGNAKEKEAYAYTGKAVKPEVTVTINGTALTTKQYKVQYQNNKDAGTAYVIVTGKGEYKGKIVVPFTIKAETVASQNDFTIKEIKEKTFNGKLQKPSVTVSITKNGKAKKLSKKDYTVAYKNNFHAGEATVIVTGKRNYAGLSATATFTIKPQQMKKASLKGTKDNLTLTYNKRKLKEGYDYESPVYSAEDKNKVEVTIKAKENGDFTGTMTKKIKMK